MAGSNLEDVNMKVEVKDEVIIEEMNLDGINMKLEIKDEIVIEDVNLDVVKLEQDPLACCSTDIDIKDENINKDLTPQGTVQNAAVEEDICKDVKSESDGPSTSGLKECSVSSQIKMEALSPIQEQLDDSEEEIDIEYNIDMDKEYKLMKNELFYMPKRIENKEVETGLTQCQNVSSVPYTFLREPDQTAESKCCLFEEDSELNPQIMSSSSCIDNDVLLKTQPPNELHGDAGEKGFTYDICKMPCSKKQQLFTLMRSNTGEKLFSCNICRRLFTLKRTLLRHIRTHTGEKPFPCNICKSPFARKDLLVTHMRTHTGEKLISCNICNKFFTQKYHLSIHMRTHTGEKPVSCNICNKSFTQKYSLSIHMRTHTGEKPFSCNICYKSFTQKYNLSVHMRTHTGKKLFSCNICNKSFTLKHTLLTHMRIHT